MNVATFVTNLELPEESNSVVHRFFSMRFLCY